MAHVLTGEPKILNLREPSKGNGRIAQLVRALALQARGPKFESWYAHHSQNPI